MYIHTHVGVASIESKISIVHKNLKLTCPLAGVTSTESCLFTHFELMQVVMWANCYMCTC